MPDQYHGKEIIYWDDLPRITENDLPPKAYYSLEDAAAILKCRPMDVLHYAATERLDIVASTVALSVAAVLTRPEDSEFDPTDTRQESIEFIALNAGIAREVELKGEASMRFAFWGYSVDNPVGVYGTPPWELGYRLRGSYRFFSLDEIVEEEDFSEDPLDQITITMKSIYVMAVSLYRFKLGLPAPENELARRQQFSTEIGKVHGNTERFAKTRESVLKAAIYCKEMWPEQCQESTTWASVIDSKAPLFWPEEGKPPLSLDRIERLLGEARKLASDVR